MVFLAFSCNYFHGNIAHETSRLAHTIAEGSSLFSVMGHFDNGCKVSALFQPSAHRRDGVCNVVVSLYQVQRQALVRVSAGLPSAHD